MLSKVLKEHQARQANVRLENEKLRKEALNSVARVTETLVDQLNYRVADIFRNQKKLEAEAKTLQTLSTRYTKQTTQWLSMIENFNSALKELGDVQSWAQSIEGDMRVIASALEYVHQGSAGFVDPEAAAAAATQKS